MPLKEEAASQVCPCWRLVGETACPWSMLFTDFRDAKNKQKHLYSIRLTKTVTFIFPTLIYDFFSFKNSDIWNWIILKDMTDECVEFTNIYLFQIFPNIFFLIKKVSQTQLLTSDVTISLQSLCDGGSISLNSNWQTCMEPV